MSKSRDKDKRFERGKSMSLYIKSDASDKLLDWLNSHREVSSAITDILERVINDEYIHKSVLFEYLDRSRAEDSLEGNRGKAVEKDAQYKSEPESEVDYNDEEPDYGDAAIYNQPQANNESTEVEEEEKKEETYIDPDDIDFGDENPFAKKKKEEPKKKKGMPRIRSSSFDTHSD